MGRLKLEECSVRQLEEYLVPNKKEPLSKKRIDKIIKVIEKKRIENEITAEKWVNSSIWKLGIYQVIREGKAKKVKCGKEYYYDISAGEVLIAIQKIILALSEGTDEVKEDYERYIK